MIHGGASKDWGCKRSEPFRCKVDLRLRRTGCSQHPNLSTVSLNNCTVRVRGEDISPAPELFFELGGGKHYLDALRAVEGEEEGGGRVAERTFRRHQLQHIDLARYDQGDGFLVLPAETEGALEVQFLRHDGVGGDRHGAARQVADLDHGTAAPDGADGGSQTSGGTGNFKGDFVAALGRKRLELVVSVGDIDDGVG